MRRRLCQFAFLLLLSTCVRAGDRWRVVILPGADPTQPAVALQIRSLRSTLTAAAPDGVEFYTDSLDELRFDDANLMPEFRALLRRKYEHKRVDMVIGIADFALEFTKRYHEAIWPGAPVLMTSIDESRAERTPQISHFFRGISMSTTRSDYLKRCSHTPRGSWSSQGTVPSTNSPPGSPLDLNSTVEETLALLATEARRRRVGIEADLNPGCPMIVGDAIQLQQVILNLCVNALDAMEDIDPSKRLLAIATSPVGWPRHPRRCEIKTLRLLLHDQAPRYGPRPLDRTDNHRNACGENYCPRPLWRGQSFHCVASLSACVRSFSGIAFGTIERGAGAHIKSRERERSEICNAGIRVQR
ncbi:hypothetical protein H3V53_04005 [Paraburkholderia bengalensis]|uniref:Uncharacterized protein n=1 Tax=Paraburkholderia bengalensis TaxID=2747562 RepID=A0ABU8ILE3_9BURK